MKKPLLNNLPGSYTFSLKEREEYSIPQGLFTNEERQWSNLQSVSELYLNECEEYGTAEETLTSLDDTLNRLNNKLKNKKGRDKLLFNDCESLKAYYKEANIQKWFSNYYNRAEIQSRSLALAMSTQESSIMENNLVSGRLSNFQRKMKDSSMLTLVLWRYL